MNVTPVDAGLTGSRFMVRPGIVTNAVAFQIGWFACVISAGRGTPWMGTTLAALVVLVHILRARRRSAALQLVAATVLVGAVWDGALAMTGVLTFAPGPWLGGAAPLWILALWALFATTLNVSLRWLHGRWFSALVLGALLGPASYLAGERFGAVLLGPDRASSLLILSLGWAVLTPITVWIAQRRDAFAAEVAR